MSYKDKLRDPRWQRRRLDVLNAANWTCQDAGCKSNTKTLEVHHCYYLPDTDPWDYPTDAYLALCEDCHEERQQLERDIKISLSRCLRLVPIQRLKRAAIRLFSEALEEIKCSL
jgi:hypothetical protein